MDEETITTEEKLTYQEALKIIGGVSMPSKMPFYGWAISATTCKTGGKLQKIEGSTCSSCYAMRGQYQFKNVKEAHARRLVGLSNPRFSEAMLIVINQLHKGTKKTYVRDGVTVRENRWRWHDSGDLISVEHLDIINEIALKTPFIDHWLPTREYGFVNEYLKSGKTFAPNLTVRMSAVMKGKGFAERPMGLPFSTVGFTDPTVEQCKAYTQGGKCLDCRACWDKDADINYPLH